ncbi:glucose-1-phosphate thymidylyltransferase [Streptomyces olivoverticillatus]
MKALVLAGGTGSRLRPITHTSAKQLVPVANKPVLFYGLEAIRDCGIRDVGIIVGETAAEVRAAVGDGSRFGLSVTYIPQAEPLGLAHCVLIARDYLADDDFLMYLGDNFVIARHPQLRRRLPRPAARRPDPADQGRRPHPVRRGRTECGGAGDRGRGEAEPSPRATSPSSASTCSPPLVHEAVRTLRPSHRGELEITDAVQVLIREHADVSSHVITGYWKDTGRVEDMLECNRMVLENIEPRLRGTADDDSEIVGRVDVAEDVVITRSRLVGPLTIGPGAVVTDSYVGPFTSIGPGCRLEGTEIEYSIVMDRSSIRGVPGIRDSLIGKDVEVSPAAFAPRAHQLIVGDHSRVRLNR